MFGWYNALNSTQLNSTQLNSTQLNSTQLNSTQLNSTQLNSTQLNSAIARLCKACLFALLFTLTLGLAHCSSSGGGGGGNGDNPTDTENPPTDLPKEPDPRCANAPQSSGFNDGDGMTENTPFLICTYAQLGMMSANLGAHYALGDDIDAGSSDWTPVGDADSEFSGTLDGRDYVISDLTVNTSGDYGGLFGYAGTAAKIRNVGLRDVDITAVNYASGLVGYNIGNISNSYVTGSVTGNSSGSSDSAAGGFVGFNAAVGEISNSYARVTVMNNSTKDGRAGGLVGYNLRGKISNSYAMATVTATAAGMGYTAIAGRLVGINFGSISNSYATGMAMATGGTFGYAGGLVGNNEADGTISNSYWDTDTGLTDACGTGTCPSDGGLTTDEMQDGSSAALGDGFQINAGSYPKVKKCTVCTGTLDFSDELVPGQ